MAIGFAVRGQGEQARTGGPGQAPEKLFAVGEQPVESHGLGQGTVVEKHGHGPTRRQQDLVGPADVQGAGIHGAPRLAVVADGRGLGRGQDGEGDAGGGQGLQGRCVHGRLGQPHALGRPAEPGREIGNGPGDFQLFVHIRGQWHDHVVVDLGQGIAMSQPGQTLAVGLQESGMGVRGRAGKPGEQGGADVETHPLVAVDELGDVPGAVQPSGPGQRRVGLAADALVPVAARGGAALGQDVSQPGIVPGRLVKMAVDA